MCGINGIYSFCPEVKLDRSIKLMNRAIAKRGPDDEGIYAKGPVILGSRRLSIIDLNKGSQPIFNEDRSLAIVFNGEIYNYLSLRKYLLKKGHRFYTNSDTETIVHLYEEEGTKCLNKLDGMFAFALWDQKRKSLLLARDPLGKKPLHWYKDENKLIFSSEIKGILAFPGFKREIDTLAMGKYFLYGFIPAPLSIFKGIRKILPGEYVLVEGSGKIKEGKYWNIDYSSKHTNANREELVEQIDKLLFQAVEKRLNADVPVGVFLSGGIDSSLVTAMMAEIIGPSKVESFTIGFKEKKFDESPLAVRLAKHLGVQHHLKLFKKSELIELIPRLMDIMDEPMADPSIFPTFLLSSFTRHKVKVALSGDGGDETFAGYPKYLAHLWLEKTGLGRLPLQFFSGLASGKEALFFKFANFPLSLRNQLWISPFSEGEVESLAGVKTGYDEINRYEQEFGGRNILDLALFLDQKLTLADLYLVKTDRASMAASLEVRCPMLDKKLVEYSAKIPFKEKIIPWENKFLLKKVAQKYLPPEILNQPKRGLGLPLSYWFEEINPTFKTLCSKKKIEKEGRLNFKAVENIVKYGNIQQKWTLFIFELWQERWLKN